MRSSYLLYSDFYKIEEWCQKVRFVLDGEVPYMVGSSITRSDYRDIDIRVILSDRIFDRRFKIKEKLLFANLCFSMWGQSATGLPVDFQFQRRTEANELYGGMKRNPLGLRTIDSFHHLA